ncbi:MAG: hypothetical protein WBO00_03030 [Steroidobacteraceae bacterium]
MAKLSHQSVRASAIVATVLVIGYLTYAIKGLYWALLDHCPVPRAQAFQIYFSSIAICGFAGAWVCAAFHRRNKRRRLYAHEGQGSR